MPELPEVQTVRHILEPQLTGRSVTKLELRRPEIVKHPSVEIFRDIVTGSTLSGMDRRGKFLLLHLENGSSVILHLRMTGQLLVTPDDFPEEKHTHVIFHLDNGCQLRFVDSRRFGRFWLRRAGEEDIYSGIHKLGLEPFDANCNNKYLEAKLGGRRKTIKECLLDQSVVAGIGNIYGDEILHASRLHPSRLANSLTSAEWQTLASSIPAVLRYMITKNNMTPAEYLSGLGKEYRNTPSFQVYGRKGQPCYRCGTALQSMRIGGRNSSFCPACQLETSLSTQDAEI